jgi:hypothetical protein
MSEYETKRTSTSDLLDRDASSKGLPMLRKIVATSAKDASGYLFENEICAVPAANVADDVAGGVALK